VAMASTFTAPPTSTPTMSPLIYTRKLGCKGGHQGIAHDACRLAATSAGRLRATSCAAGATARQLSNWELPAHTPRASSPKEPKPPVPLPRSPCTARPCFRSWAGPADASSAAMGVATMTRSAARQYQRVAPDTAAQAGTPGGSAFCRRASKSATCGPSRAHNVTARPPVCRAAPMASAVPQAPAPSTFYRLLALIDKREA
jgi:hypothetical protein